MAEVLPISPAVAIQCLETAFGVTLGDSDLALPQTLPEIFEAAAAGQVSAPHPVLESMVAVVVTRDCPV